MCHNQLTKTSQTTLTNGIILYFKKLLISFLDTNSYYRKLLWLRSVLLYNIEAYRLIIEVWTSTKLHSADSRTQPPWNKRKKCRTKSGKSPGDDSVHRVPCSFELDTLCIKRSAHRFKICAQKYIIFCMECSPAVSERLGAHFVLCEAINENLVRDNFSTQRNLPIILCKNLFSL